MEPAKEQQPARASALHRLTLLRLGDEGAAAAPHRSGIRKWFYSFRVDAGEDAGEEEEEEEEPGAEESSHSQRRRLN